MKNINLLITLFCLFPARLAAQGTATLTFEETRVELRNDNFSVGYPDFDKIPVGGEIQLAARTVLVRLEENESAGMIRFVTVDKHIGYFERNHIFTDRTTSAEDNFHSDGTGFYEQEKIGSRAGYFVGEKKYDRSRYAEIMLFPVTVDTDGALTFHRSITLTVGDRVITGEQLLSENEVRTWILSKNTWPATNTLSSACDYVIVTCQALFEAFAGLAAYKNETGYDVRVELIDDIIADYSGRDDAEKLREYLKDFYGQGGHYVLLGGDQTNLPVRYAYDYHTDGTIGFTELQICDLYFADLTGEWDSDNDGVWGEKYDDSADFEPELYVGRLPFYDTAEVNHYLANLIRYETDPGGGDRTYLNRTFFFSSDQMRDYSDGGQHGRVAASFPERFLIDTLSGVEQASGDDLEPDNLPPAELSGILRSGYSLVNVIAHGRSDGFTVLSSGYNEWPKAYFLSAAEHDVHGSFDSIIVCEKPAFYYSIACNTGAFDFDQPAEYHSPNMAQYLLGLEGGAVGFVSQSRWGWVGSSYLMQKVFYDSLFAFPERPVIDAMQASKRAFSYLRDLVLGQNFYGDPTLKIYTELPDTLAVTYARQENEYMRFRVVSGDSPVPDCRIRVTQDGLAVGDFVTGQDGELTAICPLDFDRAFTVVAFKPGYVVKRVVNINLSLTDVDDEPENLPYTFALAQNYPNPFNPGTVIAFELPRRTHAKLAIFNTLGQKVRTLIDRDLAFGRHEIYWDGLNDSGGKVAGGVYFYRLVADYFSESKKMILLK
ncbi:MAG: C25 family cysteine peptidase [Candidatus Zixiibacteriota bacterium]